MYRDYSAVRLHTTILFEIIVNLSVAEIIRRWCLNELDELFVCIFIPLATDSKTFSANINCGSTYFYAP